MLLGLTAGVWVNILGGIVLMALAVGVALVRPRRRANLAFAAFCALWGAPFLLSNVVRSRPDLPSSVLATLSLVSASLFVGCGVAAILLFRRFPRPLSARETGAYRRSLGLAIGFMLVAAVGILGLESQTRLNVIGAGAAGYALITAVLLQLVGIFTAILLMPARFAATTPDEHAIRRQLALTYSALVLWPAFVAGAGFFGNDGWVLSSLARRPGDILFCGALAGALLFSSARWLYVCSRSPESRVARDAALVPVAMMVAGTFYGILPNALELGGYGIVRIVCATVLAYAILRFQLLGLDLRLKWTIKRGAVAAIVLGAFFIVAQIGEAFLSQRGGLVFGGVAAGLLLFAISPLQRMAERLANAALPNVEDTPQWRSARGEESFRMAIRMALQDGIVTREEERTLAMLATDLGIPAARAFELREEIERALTPQARG